MNNSFDFDVQYLPNENSPTRHFEIIVSYIIQAIRDGRLKQGERLPSERELAQHFQTSRIPVREAIKILEFCGIIVPMVGGGMQIKNADFADILKKFSALLLRPDDTARMNDLFDLRLLLESYAAGLAAQNASQHDLDEMQNALCAMDEDLKFGRLPFVNSHRFHDAVIAASGNVILTDIYKLLYYLLDISRTHTIAEFQQQSQSLEDHREIYAAIHQRDSQRATELMRSHLSALAMTYSTQLPTPGKADS